MDAMRAHACINCGYDLSKTARGAKCPECGLTATTAEEAFDPKAIARRKARWAGAFAVCILMLLIVATLWKFIRYLF